MEKKNAAPKWIVVYLWLSTFAALTFSILAYLKPEAQFKDWPALNTAGALSLAGPLGLYIARNLATAATSLFAALNKSVNVLIAALLLRAVTDGIDLIHNAITGNFPIAVFAFVLCIVELAAIIKLKKLN